jgi:hypothetical protein
LQVPVYDGKTIASRHWWHEKSNDSECVKRKKSLISCPGMKRKKGRDQKLTATFRGNTQ